MKTQNFGFSIFASSLVLALLPASASQAYAEEPHQPPPPKPMWSFSPVTLRPHPTKPQEDSKDLSQQAQQAQEEALADEGTPPLFEAQTSLTLQPIESSDGCLKLPETIHPEALEAMSGLGIGPIDQMYGTMELPSFRRARSQASRTGENSSSEALMQRRVLAELKDPSGEVRELENLEIEEPATADDNIFGIQVPERIQRMTRWVGVRRIPKSKFAGSASGKPAPAGIASDFPKNRPSLLGGDDTRSPFKLELLYGSETRGTSDKRNMTLGLGFNFNF